MSNGRAPAQSLSSTWKNRRQKPVLNCYRINSIALYPTPACAENVAWPRIRGIVAYPRGRHAQTASRRGSSTLEKISHPKQATTNRGMIRDATVRKKSGLSPENVRIGSRFLSAQGCSQPGENDYGG